MSNFILKYLQICQSNISYDENYTCTISAVKNQIIGETSGYC